jgi:hypothetical protein
MEDQGRVPKGLNVHPLTLVRVRCRGIPTPFVPGSLGVSVEPACAREGFGATYEHWKGIRADGH